VVDVTKMANSPKVASTVRRQDLVALRYHRATIVTVGNDDERPRQVVHLRVEADLYDAIREYAMRTRRSVNSAVVYLMEQGLAAEEEGR